MMTEPVSAKKAFSRAAPAYEPEVWNNRYSPADYKNFLDTHHTLIAKLYAKEITFANNIEERLRLDPVLGVKGALRVFNKSVEQGLSDAAIAEKFGVDAAKVAAFRVPATAMYLGQGFQDYANCYSYAMNDPDRYSYQGDHPGARIEDTPAYTKLFEEESRVERERDYEGFKKNLLKQIEADGAIIGGPDAEPIAGYYRVAVYTMPPEKAPKGGDNPWSDFHFMREDAGGGWSHKPGSLPVTNKDHNGKPMSDPKTAEIGGYEFVSFIYVPEGGLDVGHRYEPATKKATPHKDVDPEEDWKRKGADPFPERQLTIKP